MEVAVGSGRTVVEIEGEGSRLIVLAHGAGGNKDARAIVALKNLFVSRGFKVARFNFLYKMEGKSMPDRMPRLVECYKAVADAVRGTDVLICGGHSMGGRTASHLAAEGYNMDGLLLLAYPLHPAGSPEKLRIDHLPSIQAPTLCLCGTKDPLCTQELMEKYRPKDPRWTQHWIQNADHSYAATGRKPAEVMGEIGDAVENWANGLG